VSGRQSVWPTALSLIWAIAAVACAGRAATERRSMSVGGALHDDQGMAGSLSSGAAAGVGSGASVAGEADQEAGTPTPTPDKPLVASARTCSAFLDMWRYRLADSPPGMTGDNPCGRCIDGAAPPCPYPLDCGYAPNCIERNCLCREAPPISKVECDQEPPPDLCGCVADCLPEPQAPCDQDWVDYFSCVVARCKSECQP
jgi:hypothetical protein